MADEDWKRSAIATKFPSYRNSGFVTTHSWLTGKRVDDEAEGLWRVNNSIYDLSDFIDKHPGGSFWLRETKGTDITEAFEAHHLSNGPAKLLEHFKVRDASMPRTYTITLHENGFYKTLKRRVRDKLQTIDHKQNHISMSNFIHMALLGCTFLFATLSVKFASVLLALLAGATLTWTIITAHNYFHKKDNWRMYTFNLSMMNFCAWRVSHALSHHIYPNTYLDLELSMFEPFLCWVPNPYIKNLMMRYVSWLTEPLTYTIAYFLQISTRIIYSLRKTNIMYWHDIIPLSLPLFMYMTNDCCLLLCIKQWLLLTAAGSFLFCVIGLNAAHHDPAIYHEGDKPRQDRDWGLLQVDTIIERSEIRMNLALTLTHFGDHALHHLFPTLDHAILPHLYPILYETLNEFKGELREQTIIQHLIGQHKQLLRMTPNPREPGAHLK